VKIEIYYCVPCGYRGRARHLAERIREALGLEAQVIKGSWAQFDVLVDGVRIASKLGDAGIIGKACGIGKFPDEDETIEKIRALQAPVTPAAPDERDERAERESDKPRQQ
jgi:selT/selW/selH-like putative selenoprotein